MPARDGVPCGRTGSGPGIRTKTRSIGERPAAAVTARVGTSRVWPLARRGGQRPSTPPDPSPRDAPRPGQARSGSQLLPPHPALGERPPRPGRAVVQDCDRRLLVHGVHDELCVVPRRHVRGVDRVEARGAGTDERRDVRDAPVVQQHRLEAADDRVGVAQRTARRQVHLDRELAATRSMWTSGGTTSR